MEIFQNKLDKHLPEMISLSLVTRDELKFVMLIF